MNAILVHSPDNANLADNIATNLRMAGVSIIKDSRRLADRDQADKAIAQDRNGALILLVTDNFLKDRECMYDAIHFLKDPQTKSRVYPIVGDGRHLDKEGRVSYSPTLFERVKNVIHYIDYWGDAFLGMRKRKREKDYQNETAFNQELEQVRAISSEVGEFLRILRGMEYIQFEDLHETKYQAFFRRKSWDKAHSNLLEKELAPFITDTAEAPPVDIQSIPGMEMLMDKTQEDAFENVEAEKDVPMEIVPEHPEPNGQPEGGFFSLLDKFTAPPSETDQAAQLPEDQENKTLEIVDVAPDITSIVPVEKESEEIVEKIVEEAQNGLSPEELKEKAEFEQSGLSYQDKSSYELLISLFEDSEEDEEQDTNPIQQEQEDELPQKSWLHNIREELSLINEEKQEQDESEPEQHWDDMDGELPQIPSFREEKPLFQESMMNKGGEIHVQADDALVPDPQAPKTDEKPEEAKIEDLAGDEPENPAAEIDDVEKQAPKPLIPEDRPELDLEDIRHTKENGDIPAALFMLKEALELQPDNTDVRYEYASILSDALQNPEEAKYQYNIILEHAPQHVPSLLELAAIYEQDGDYLNAKYCYQKALEADTNNPKLHYDYAQLLNHHFKAQKKKAAKHYKKAFKQDPNHVDALYQYAVLLYEYKGKPKKALSKFKEVVKLAPNHLFANYDIAVLYYEMHEGQQAAEYYRAAYQNNPELRTPKNDEAFRVEQYLRPHDEGVVLEEHSISDITELEQDYDISLLDTEPISGQVPISHLAQDINHLLETEEDEEEDEDDGLDDFFEYEKEADTPSLKEVEEEEEEEEEWEAEEEWDEEELEEEEEEEEWKAEESPLSFLPNIPVAPLVDASEWTESPSLLDELMAAPMTTQEPASDATPDTSTIALITGATSGIGQATARLFAQKGHHLIITGRRASRLEELKAQLEGTYGIHVETLTFDVRSLNASRKAMDSLDPRFKNVDILVNNAGLAKGFSPIHEGDIDDWETMIDTNIKGLLYMTRLVSPGMVARGKGHIINIGSIAGKEAYPNGNVYCATKHAVDALTQAMRIDLHKYNIRVSSVCPGAVEETEFSLVRFNHDAEKAKDYQSFTPLNSRDIAEIIYFVTTRPAHVNVQDVLVMATQQATATITDDSGRK